MDPNLIYVKTASGENAIQQRTLVIQRNVRMVLILVDGRSSVTDLIHKIGNSQLTENALAELEKGGFIEIKQDSLWAESQRVSQEVRASAIEKAMQTPQKDENRGNNPNLKQPVSHPSARHAALDESEPSGLDKPIPLNSEFFDIKDEVDFSASRFSLPPDMALSETPISVKETANKRKKHGTSFLAKLKPMFSRADRAPDDKPIKPIKIKPVRYKTRRVTSWTALLFFGFIGIVVIACAVVLLFPFNVFVHDFETAFSLAIGRPVSIQEVRVDVRPESGFVLSDVQIGQGNDAVRIREIYLQPDLMSLFSERRGFRRVVVSGTELKLERVTQMPTLFVSLSDPNRSPKIDFILFKNTDISFNGLVLEDMEAQIQRDSADRLQALVARTTDKSLTLTAEPVGARVDLTVEAFAWPGDIGARFFSDSLDLKARLEKNVMMISDLKIRIFGGLIKGDAVVHADGTEPNLSGNVSFERIDSSRLTGVLGLGKKLAGDAAGTVRFTANSKTWPTILSSLKGEGEFSFQRGNLYGFDLADVARRGGSGLPIQGGMTTFEQMSGQMRLTPERVQFYDLDIVLGLMRSTGYIDVANDGRLAGSLELLMKGSVNQIRIPLNVIGTLNSPAVQTLR
jgi:hypothetical protein